MARSRRNEFVAGLFILVAIAVLVFMLVLVGNWEDLYRAQTVYYAEFDRVPNLKEGSPVLLRGSQIGRVSEMTLKKRVVDEKTRAVEYHFLLALEVPSDIVLRRDANIGVGAAMVGETAWVDIRCVGTGDVATDTQSDPLMGRGGGMMEAAAEAFGVGEKQKAEIAAAIENLKEISASLRETAPKIASVTDNVEAVTGDLKQRMPDIMAKADDTMAKMNSAAERVNNILDENRENLKSSVGNVAAITERAKKDFAELLDSLKAASRDIQALVAANRMNLSDAMVNIRQTSEQLKAASVEIRRAPWRLLHKPDDRESDTMNVFDASRNYANAVADLRSTATTLKALVDLKKEGVPVDAEVLATMFDRLKAGIAKYEEAESALWKQWGKVSE